jgi:hypothetical protein
MNTQILTATIVMSDPIVVYGALFIVAAAVILIYLMVKSSDDYSEGETEKNAEEFAGEAHESKGPVTKWLWVVYLGLIIWAVAYLVQHWSEFATFP